MFGPDESPVSLKTVASGGRDQPGIFVLAASQDDLGKAERATEVQKYFGAILSGDVGYSDRFKVINYRNVTCLRAYEFRYIPSSIIK